MFQVRIHGRGGQGVVTSAELLSYAAFLEGRHSLAFPSFGSERTGAPVMAFVRVDDKAIRVREPVMSPDGLVIGDATLLHQMDVLAGLAPDGFLLVNSARTPDDLGLGEVVERLLPHRVLSVPATEIALRLLGRPLPHAALLGAFAALTDIVSLAALTKAIEERFSGPVAEANVGCATEAHEHVRNAREGLLRATTP